MKKTIWIIMIIAVVAGVTAAWYFLRGKENSAITWKTGKIEKGDVKIIVTATGTLSPDTTVQVGTQVSGVISKIFVDFNSVVKKGQVVALIDTTYLAAAVEDANSSLFSANVRVDLAKRNYDRTKQLFEQKVMAQADYDQAYSDYQTALASARSARSSLLRARINLRYATIIAPVSGVVISRNVDIGQTVAASFSTPTLFSIANDLTKMQLQASIDEADIGKIEVGQEVTFTVDAYMDRTFSGTVRQIRLQPVNVQNVVNYTVIIDVPNPDMKLLPGMTANLTVKIQQVQDVMKVSAGALRFWPPQDWLNKAVKNMPDSTKKLLDRIMQFQARRSGQGSSFGQGSSAGQGNRGNFSQGGFPGGTVSGGQQGFQGGQGSSRWQGGGEGRPSRGRLGILWMKEGEKVIPIRVHTGLTDGTVTEISGPVNEGMEVVTGIINTGNQAQQQQVSPFSPQMGRSRGGR